MFTNTDISFVKVINNNSIHLTPDISGVVSINLYPVVGKYTGYFYTILAQGGFYIQQTFPRFNLVATAPSPTFKIGKYDVTNALQILFDVKIFNEKLGLYNPTIQKFANDSIILNANEFASNIKETQIISLGLYTNLYQNFIHYVNNYFSYAGDFSTLFSSSDELLFKNNTFDEKSFIELIRNYSYDENFRFIPQINGTISINGINSLIQYVNNNNTFGNRPVDIMNEGFVEGDLILIPSGITITLGLNMDFNNTISRPELFKIKQDINSQCSNTRCANPCNTNKKNTPFTSLSDIKQTITAPLLIKMHKM